MGQGQSADISPPWIPAPGKRYPKEIEQAIIGLAQSEDSFLSPADSDDKQPEFILDDHYDEIEAVVQFDNQLALQAEKLVPSQVTEQQFWSNYFSHVNALRARGDSLIAESEARIASHSEIAEEARSENPTVEQDLNMVSAPVNESFSTSELENTISSLLKDYAESSLSPIRQMRWGIIGGISEAITDALTMDKVGSIAGVVGSASPQIKKKLKVYSNSTELITNPNIDVIYVGECATDVDCIELCKLALQNEKHCLVHSNRAFCSAYALFRVDSQSCLSALWPIASFSSNISLMAMLLANNYLGPVCTVVYQFSIPTLELKNILPSNCSPFEWAAAPILHILDILFGPLLNVQGYAKCITNIEAVESFEDSAVFHFHAKLGAIGCAIFSFNSTTREDQLHIDGSRGHISVPVFNPGQPTVRINGEVIKIPEDAVSSPTKELRFLHSFIAGCESGRSNPFFSASEKSRKTN